MPENNNNEVLEAIHDLATQMDIRFETVGRDITAIKATMVTKEYLDDKLSDLKGDLVVLMRKEDRKVSALVDVLRVKQVLSDEEAKRILTMEPFPQIF